MLKELSKRPKEKIGGGLVGTTAGRETEISNGIKQEYGGPVLHDGDKTAVKEIRRKQK